MNQDRELYDFEEEEELRGGAFLVTVVILAFMFFLGMGAGYLISKIIF